MKVDLKILMIVKRNIDSTKSTKLNSTLSSLQRIQVKILWAKFIACFPLTTFRPILILNTIKIHIENLVIQSILVMHHPSSTIDK